MRSFFQHIKIFALGFGDIKDSLRPLQQFLVFILLLALSFLAAISMLVMIQQAQDGKTWALIAQTIFVFVSCAFITILSVALFKIMHKTTFNTFVCVFFGSMPIFYTAIDLLHTGFHHGPVAAFFAFDVPVMSIFVISALGMATCFLSNAVRYVLSQKIKLTYEAGYNKLTAHEKMQMAAEQHKQQSKYPPLSLIQRHHA